MIRVIEDFRQQIADEKAEYKKLLDTDPAFQGGHIVKSNNLDIRYHG